MHCDGHTLLLWAMSAVLAWVHAGAFERCTVANSNSDGLIKSSIPTRSVWSPYVISSLVGSGHNVCNSTAKWAVSQRAQYKSQVLGLAMLEVDMSPDPMTFLTPQQLEVRRFWSQILHADYPLAFFKVAAACAFKDIQFAHVEGAPHYSVNARQPSSVFFSVTLASAERLFSCDACRGTSRLEVPKIHVGNRLFAVRCGL